MMTREQLLKDWLRIKEDYNRNRIKESRKEKINKIKDESYGNKG
jgi:hypothetical protein